MNNIRYASIRTLDVSNGEGVGVALFVQGCRFRCYNCFNPETWDFNGGKKWTSEIKEKFLTLIDRPYIKRVSILGGEPLAEENLDDVLDLVTEINRHSDKVIWLYTGYEMKYILDNKYRYHPQTEEKLSTYRNIRKEIIDKCNVVIDGRYIDKLKDISLLFRGSKNQNIWKKKNNVWINQTDNEHKGDINE